MKTKATDTGLNGIDPAAVVDAVLRRNGSAASLRLLEVPSVTPSPAPLSEKDGGESSSIQMAILAPQGQVVAGTGALEKVAEQVARAQSSRDESAKGLGAAESERHVAADEIRSGDGLKRDVLVGRSVLVTGKMTVPGRVVVDGEVSGELQADEVVVRSGGRVKGLLKARRVDVSGTVDGDVVATERMVIEATGYITGTCVYGGGLTVRAGAVLQGQFSGSEAGMILLREAERELSQGGDGQSRSTLFGKVKGVIGLV